MLAVLAISIQPPKVNSSFAVCQRGGATRRMFSTRRLARPSSSAATRRASTAAASTDCRFGAISQAAPSGSNWNRKVPKVWLAL